MSLDRRNHYLPTLDGWRGLSVLAVVVYHGTAMDSDRVIRNGYMGVLVFFAISGYLITERLLDEIDENGQLSFRRFYLRRAFRILPPAYLVLLTLGGLSAAGMLRVGWSEVLACVGFARNFGPPSGTWYTAHFWSLAVEEQFYLFWPLILWLGVRRARWASAGIILLCGAWRLLANRHALPRIPDYDYIMWGCWWAMTLRDRRWGELFQRAVSTPVWLALVALFAAIADQRPRGSSSMLGLVIPLVVLGTVRRPSSVAGRVLEWKPLRWVGRVSYGLYLWQQLFFVRYSFEPTHPLQRLPWNAVALFSVAALSYYLLERPVLRVGRSMALAVDQSSGAV